MTRETILNLLKLLTNPEVEKLRVIDYEQLVKTLAPFLINYLPVYVGEATATAPVTRVSGSLSRTAMGLPVTNEHRGRCIP